jgi:hypothetical protein
MVARTAVLRAGKRADQMVDLLAASMEALPAVLTAASKDVTRAASKETLLVE